ncbi:MAG: T9SS type A sorting domain-containing protein, partial [Cytophagales bacterium]|nr:T9SS type A sorting domain-containing protein [Cytophagales bacterium]
AGKVLSTELPSSAETLFEEFIDFEGTVITDPNGREINITATDVEAQNGVVHIIDRVLLPELLPATVVDIATGDENFSTLVAALTREDLSTDFVEVLSGEGPFTVFAPTNAAFTALLAELEVESLDDIDAETLEAVLLMHVVAGKVLSTELPSSAETLFEEFIDFEGTVITDPNGREINITATDIEAQNGVVHVIDRVLLPEQTTEITGIATAPILLEAYPNPTSGRVVLRGLYEGEISVRNSQGSLVATYTVSSGLSALDLSGLAGGVYYLNFGSEYLRVVKL